MKGHALAVAKIASIFVGVGSIATASWLKDYMIDNQGTWVGRSELMKVTIFAPDLVAPGSIGYAYYVPSLLFLMSVGLMGVVWKKGPASE